MGRPTDDAKANFASAGQQITIAGTRIKAAQTPSPADQVLINLSTARAIWHLTAGLNDLAVGLRATYMKLEELQILLQKRA